MSEAFDVDVSKMLSNYAVGTQSALASGAVSNAFPDMNDKALLQSSFRIWLRTFRYVSSVAGSVLACTLRLQSDGTYNVEKYLCEEPVQANVPVVLQFVKAIPLLPGSLLGLYNSSGSAVDLYWGVEYALTGVSPAAS